MNIEIKANAGLHKILIQAFSLFPTLAALFIFINTNNGLYFAYLIVTLIFLAISLAIDKYWTTYLIKVRGEVTFEGSLELVTWKKYLMAIALIQFVLFIISIYLLINYVFSSVVALILLVYSIVGYTYTLIYSTLSSDVSVIKATIEYANMLFKKK